MKRPLILLALMLLAITPAAFAVTYTGSLSTPTGVTATGGWTSANDGFVISWEITQQGDGNWYYLYNITNEDGDPLTKAVSHGIFEISDNATASDFWGASTTWEINTYSDASPSNPYMPGSMYGIKLDNNSPFSFYSSKAATWGDFYAKDGKTGGPNGIFVTAWNADFLDADPTDAPQSGLLQDAAGNYIYKILRPDSETTTVPEPGTMMLLGLGLTGLGILRRKK